VSDARARTLARAFCVAQPSWLQPTGITLGAADVRKSGHGNRTLAASVRLVQNYGLRTCRRPSLSVKDTDVLP
jgi:hypothetical protein